MMSHYTVGLMASQDRARWDDFVLRCPNATFFHRAGWQRIMEESLGHRTWFMYAADDGGELHAVLPLAQVNSRLFGNTLCSLPFCVYGGIAATDAHAAQAVDAAAQQLAARLQVDHLEYRHRQPHHADWLHQDTYATFRKRLHADPQENMLAIPRKQRAMVRKGITAELASTVETDTGRFFDCYARSMHHLGTPMFSRRHFQLLREVFAEDCQVLCVQQASRPVCAVMSFRFRDQILPYYGGGGAQARVLAGNDFMYWEVMRRACLAGCTLFDFGRSKYGTGSFAFKKNWGFEPEPLHYDYQLHRSKQLKQVQPLNPRYQMLIKAWRLLPLSVANLIGPHIVRQLG
ncbi:FemAB family PEP-CTERM system-associated protein [Pseudoduganella sp. FT25W]|uniref:FemAB family PEP-CTERM system-associated protein n=1 Tax=Duganella alba TaxID=2666081 RepID=A0A6L5QBG0_9BURK|nr:FemAB family XrtA/PEP-CTERM system-associated protein [Duganella alba]MRX06451.1 FemAB family PEP-CTERM system-associated protein [Duganella alba]MRX14845.1 FemAB family PEP-CTERM system-associated protein [Duganella alba]